MRNTFATQFYCRKSKANKQGLSPVELSIIINKERVFINLPYRCRAEEFNRRHKPREIEEYLNAQRSVINKVLSDMAENGIPVTASNLREYYRTGGVKSYTAEDLFKDYLDIQHKRVPTTLSKGVYRKYELVRDLFFKDFDKSQECTAITNAVVLKFFAILDGKYDNSTAVGYKTKFKAFITFGLDNNKIKINPFQGIKITKERKDITYLTKNEIELLMNTPIENESLSKVRDAAVFQLSSGLSYADMCALREGDLMEENGVYFIAKNRIKTGTPFCSVVLKEGVEIYNRYGGHIPIISNQKYNVYLHQIETLCGIKTSLHSHVFRHTYATRLLNSGVKLKTVSRTLGHVNSRMTESFYAHLEDRSVIQEVSTAFA